MSIFLGCIADDFTGATDLCENLFVNGMRSVLFLGLPETSLIEAVDDTVDALVISLKIRTSPVKFAVNQAMRAFSILQAAGCRQFYWKYCSTFDSTSQGNIGPVADALLEKLDVPSAIVCPAYPQNGRTVYQSHLFVYDRLLQDTHMAEHPLTPMRVSDLRKLLSDQTEHRCGAISLPFMRDGKKAVAHRWSDLTASGVGYIVADAISMEDLRFWGDFCKDHPLLTGGSALAGALAVACRQRNGPFPATLLENENAWSGTPAPPLILAGSCSKITLEQIDVFAKEHPVFKLDPRRLTEGKCHLEEALQFVRKCQEGEKPSLIYTGTSPSEVKDIQVFLGKEKVSNLIEQSFASIARQMKLEGVRKFVVAGGETAGAVVSALEIKSLQVGKSIAPGIPWMWETQDTSLVVALKSGNFGGADFFLKTASL
jgi:uncharacterized protein YgbK (DUF1537 family)